MYQAVIAGGGFMKLSEIMKRARFIRGANKVILSLNFSNIANELDVHEIYNYSLTFVNKMPKNSMVLLLDLKGLKVNSKIETKLYQMTTECSKYFSASAIVVDNNTEQTIKSIAAKLGLVKMITYADVETASKYLLSK